MKQMVGLEIHDVNRVSELKMQFLNSVTVAVPRFEHRLVVAGLHFV